jgi:hypothetical protein
MKKNNWCLLLLTVIPSYVQAIEGSSHDDEVLQEQVISHPHNQQNSWWQSRTKTERGLIITGCAVISTVVLALGLGGAKRLFSNSKKEVIPLTDFTPLIKKEYQGYYVLIPKTSSFAFAKQKENAVFLHEETGGNSAQATSYQQEVDVVEVNIALDSNLKSITVLDPSSYFTPGTSHPIKQTREEDGVPIMYTKKLRLPGKDGSHKDYCFTCIKTWGEYVILPQHVVRSIENAQSKAQNTIPTPRYKSLWT